MTARAKGAFFGLVLAQKVDAPIPKSAAAAGVPAIFSSIPQIIATLFNLVIVIAGVIFIVLLLVGGVQYLTGAGNEEVTGKAKRLIIDAVIGLIITLAAFAIGTYILGQLGYNVPASTNNNNSSQEQGGDLGGGSSQNGGDLGSGSGKIFTDSTTGTWQFSDSPGLNNDTYDKFEFDCASHEESVTVLKNFDSQHQGGETLATCGEASFVAS